MSDLAELERQIEQRLAATKSQQILYQAHNHDRMQEMKREQRQRDQDASRAHELFESAVRPLITRLADYFDNAELLPTSETGDDCSVCSFHHDERFPATNKLELAVRPEGETGQISVKYSLEILPNFFEFEREDQLAQSANSVDEQAVNSWVERKILQFVDTYLKLQGIDPYRQENLVTDRVCGMRINKNSAVGEAQHQGHSYCFCVDDCRRSFLQEPQRYVKQL